MILFFLSLLQFILEIISYFSKFDVLANEINSWN